MQVHMRFPLWCILCYRVNRFPIVGVLKPDNHGCSVSQMALLLGLLSPSLCVIV